MDPNANLDEQLKLASRIVYLHDHEKVMSDADAARLAELVIALHGWIHTGGFLPAAWERNQ